MAIGDITFSRSWKTNLTLADSFCWQDGHTSLWNVMFHVMKGNTVKLANKMLSIIDNRNVVTTPTTLEVPSKFVLSFTKPQILWELYYINLLPIIWQLSSRRSILAIVPFFQVSSCSFEKISKLKFNRNQVTGQCLKVSSVFNDQKVLAVRRLAFLSWVRKMYQISLLTMEMFSRKP